MAGSPPVAKARNIIHGWNALRVVAMLDIASFHLTHEYLFAGIGLPTFLLLSMCLPSMAPDPGNRRAMLRRRVERLAGPWAFWTAVLATIHIVRAVKHGEPPFGWFEPKMLLEGVETHFWYLPFVTVAGWLVYELDLLARRSSRPAAWLTMCLGVGLLACYLDASFVYYDPFSQWAFAAPAIPLGLAMGSLMRDSQRVATVAFVAVFSAAATQLRAGGFAGGDGATRFALASCILVVIWLLPSRRFRWLAVVEPLMLGIFMLHVTVGYVLVDHWLPRGTLPNIPYLLSVVTLTGLAVWTMRKTRLKRFL
ncbi:MAG: hypothetical protein H6724_04205 [Sandaracinus sp.]|nr:hypothetical protein [Sandaracinus sp.]